MSFESPNTPERREFVESVTPSEVFRDLKDYIREIHHENFSLRTLLKGNAEYEVEKGEDVMKKNAGLITNRPPERVLKFFSDFYQGIIDAGYDGSPEEVLVRWISTGNPDEVNSILESGKVNGGKIDDKIGVCMSPIGSKADDTFADNIEYGSKGVLFVYDGRKLEKLSDEEAKTDIMFAGGYGYKVKDGGDFSSTILGGVGIKSSSVILPL